MSQPTPLAFFEAINAFQGTAVLKTAVELDIFTAIAEGSVTVPAIAARCSASQRGIRILCDALVIQKMLTKEDDRYVLTPSSSLFLTRTSPASLVSTVPFLTDPLLIRMYDRLTDAVKTGHTALDQEGTMAHDHPVWLEFARGMAPLMMPAAMQIVDTAGPVTKVLDVAAGHGLFGIKVAQANPEAEIYSLDWKGVLEIAQQHADAAGVGARYHRLEGSAFDLDWGSGYDLVLFTNFLHHFNPDECVTLARKAFAALSLGSPLLTLEFVPDEDRVSPSAAAWFAVTMLATTAAGDAYTFRELDSIFQRAGFGPSRIAPVENTAQSIIITRK